METNDSLDSDPRRESLDIKENLSVQSKGKEHKEKDRESKDSKDKRKESNNHSHKERESKDSKSKEKESAKDHHHKERDSKDSKDNDSESNEHKDRDSKDSKDKSGKQKRKKSGKSMKSEEALSDSNKSIPKSPALPKASTGDITELDTDEIDDIDTASFWLAPRPSTYNFEDNTDTDDKSVGSKKKKNKDPKAIKNPLKSMKASDVEGKETVVEALEDIWDTAWEICSERFNQSSASTTVSLLLRDTWLQIAEMEWMDNDLTMNKEDANTMFAPDEPPLPLQCDTWARGALQELPWDWDKPESVPSGETPTESPNDLPVGDGPWNVGEEEDEVYEDVGAEEEQDLEGLNEDEIRDLQDEIVYEMLNSASIIM